MEIESKQQKVHIMTASVVSEARGLVAALIGNQPAGTKLKTAWPRLARKLGTSERRVRAIWNGEARSIRADEMDALRSAAARKQEDYANHINAAKLDAAATALAQVDPEFHGPDIARLRDMASRLRGQPVGQVDP